MRAIIAAGLLLASASAVAQVNRCEIDGHLTWQSAPCPAGTEVEELPEPEEPRETTRLSENMEKCAAVADIAGTIMRGRQQGTSMQHMFNIMDDAWIRDIVIEAYEIPRTRSKEVQEDYIARFTDRYYLECAKEARSLE